MSPRHNFLLLACLFLLFLEGRLEFTFLEFLSFFFFFFGYLMVGGAVCVPYIEFQEALIECKLYAEESFKLRFEALLAKSAVEGLVFLFCVLPCRYLERGGYSL